MNIAPWTPLHHRTHRLFPVRAELYFWGEQWSSVAFPALFLGGKRCTLLMHLLQAGPIATSTPRRRGAALTQRPAQDLFTQPHHPKMPSCILTPACCSGKLMEALQPDPSTCKLQLAAQPCEVQLLVLFIWQYDVVVS